MTFARFSCVLVFLTLVSVVPLVAFAQPAVATLAGRVVDAQLAATPGASVTVRSLSTSTTWMATSDDGGRFTFAMLPPGEYGVEVSLSGFVTWRAEAVTLQVGQERRLDVRLLIGNLQQDVVVRGDTRPLNTVVDGVLPAPGIESLPLNGRNFLELAMLVPGNAPTPVFDPTKTNSVLVSSAGQMGRGGNITIDGQDNNDDVVGGPLLNLPIDAVQEFQIATNRFGADLGRSAGSVINVVTRSGTNTTHGSAAIFARDDGWTAVPATLENDDESAPFDRQQFSGAFGGPLRRDRVFWFGAGEFRNQDGAVLVGTRDTATRTITRSFAPAPLRDGLWSLRLDTGGSASRFMVRYAGEWATDTAASALERAIGSATQRQEATNRFNSVLGTWTAAPRSTFVNALSGSVSTFLNDTVPVATGPQLTFPSLQDGASFRMPQSDGTDAPADGQQRHVAARHAQHPRGR
jgi:Carboxypeptidase regulatory-like domain